MKRGNHLLRCALVVGAFVAWSLLACEPAEFEGGGTDQCRVSEGHVDLGNSWVMASLKGDGTRTGCTDEDYEKDFSFKLTKPLTVTQVWEGGRPTFSGSIGKSFLLKDGEINGICVSFTTEETTSGGIIRRSFDGKFDDYETSISGDMTGFGPSGCDVNGTFRVVVE